MTFQMSPECCCDCTVLAAPAEGEDDITENQYGKFEKDQGSWSLVSGDILTSSASARLLYDNESMERASFTFTDKGFCDPFDVNSGYFNGATLRFAIDYLDEDNYLFFEMRFGAQTVGGLCNEIHQRLGERRAGTDTFFSDDVGPLQPNSDFFGVCVSYIDGKLFGTSANGSEGVLHGIDLQEDNVTTMGGTKAAVIISNLNDTFYLTSFLATKSDDEDTTCECSSACLPAWRSAPWPKALSITISDIVRPDDPGDPNDPDKPGQWEERPGVTFVEGTPSCCTNLNATFITGRPNCDISLDISNQTVPGPPPAPPCWRAGSFITARLLETANPNELKVQVELEITSNPPDPGNVAVLATFEATVATDVDGKVPDATVLPVTVEQDLDHVAGPHHASPGGGCNDRTETGCDQRGNCLVLAANNAQATITEIDW